MVEKCIFYVGLIGICFEPVIHGVDFTAVINSYRKYCRACPGKPGGGLSYWDVGMVVFHRPSQRTALDRGR